MEFHPEIYQKGVNEGGALELGEIIVEGPQVRGCGMEKSDGEGTPRTTTCRVCSEFEKGESLSGKKGENRGTAPPEKPIRDEQRAPALCVNPPQPSCWGDGGNVNRKGQNSNRGALKPPGSDATASSRGRRQRKGRIWTIARHRHLQDQSARTFKQAALKEHDR